MSITRTTDLHPEFKIFRTDVQNSYICLTALVTDSDADPVRLTEVIYDRVTEILAESGAQIIHERIFGNIEIHKKLLDVRNRKIRRQFPGDPGLVTYIQGESCYGNPLAGIQLRGFCPSQSEEGVKIFRDGDEVRGRMWNRKGARFLQLQSLYGEVLSGGQTRQRQAEEMFLRAEALLKSSGASFRDVVRTWIYVDKILEWYNEFNLVRNKCYKDFGLLHNGDVDRAEDIFLPASTGIEGKNPERASTIMDLLAIAQRAGSEVQVEPLYGMRQRSPYRYGSAFSRAMRVSEPDQNWIFVSGTASLNEEGEIVHKGDLPFQVEQTVEVVNYLINPEGASFSDLCEATVFLKRKSDFSLYQETAKSLGISDIPAVYVVADVCWDELLFELDAAFVTQQ
jgi:enamine deaminase RidA (YjgF/YER057c/UK114 family)